MDPKTIRKLISTAYTQLLFTVGNHTAEHQISGWRAYFRGEHEDWFITIDGKIIEPEEFETYEDFVAAHKGKQVEAFILGEVNWERDFPE